MADIISIVINTDTRSGFSNNSSFDDARGNGTKSVDFFTDGIINKRKFFEGLGFDLEVTLYIDIHEPLPISVGDSILQLQEKGIVNNIMIAKHAEYFIDNAYFPKWKDLVILNPIIMSKGKYLVHFDGDMVAYRNPQDSRILEWIKWIEEGKYTFISYPTRYSPRPASEDPNNWKYWWASTRFFLCKRTFIDYSEIFKCLCDSEYLYGKYGDQYRRCPWLEHILGIMSGSKEKVFYPPIDMDKDMIFSWRDYYLGLIRKLDNMNYMEKVAYVRLCGGIQYPCDVKGKQL